MIDGVSIFYREAGPKDAPAVLLCAFPEMTRATTTVSAAFKACARSCFGTMMAEEQQAVTTAAAAAVKRTRTSV